MKWLNYLVWFHLLLFSCNGPKKNEREQAIVTDTSESVTNTSEITIKQHKQVITIGEVLTEMVIALKQEKKMVAYSRSHPFYPKIVRPKVGYKATLRLEFLKEQKAEAVLSDWEGSTADLALQTKLQGIEFYRFRPDYSLDGLKKLLGDVAYMLDAEKQGKKLSQLIDLQYKEIKKIHQKRKDSLRVLYLHVRGPEMTLVGGTGTPADAIIRLAGAKNAAQDFEGLKSLPPEEMRFLNPDFVIVTKKGMESLEGKAYARPVVFELTAFRLGRVILLEDYEILNFGLSAPKTALEMAKKLYSGNYYAPLPMPQYFYEDQKKVEKSPVEVQRKTSKDVEIEYIKEQQ